MKGEKERGRKERQAGRCSFVSYLRRLNSLIPRSIYYVRLYISKIIDLLLEREGAVPAPPTRALYPVHMGTLQRN